MNVLWTYNILIGLAQVFCDVLIRMRPAESLSSQHASHGFVKLINIFLGPGKYVIKILKFKPVKN